MLDMRGGRDIKYGIAIESSDVGVILNFRNKFTIILDLNFAMKWDLIYLNYFIVTYYLLTWKVRLIYF